MVHATDHPFIHNGEKHQLRMTFLKASEEMIDSRKLRVFLAVARCQSYTAAARALNTVQSSVSHTIHDLEKDLSCTLLKKSGRKMIMTEAGLMLLDHGLRLEQAMANTRRALFLAEQKGRHKFSIGSCHSIAQFFLPKITGTLFEAFPDCTFNVLTRSASEITEAVRQRELDIALSLKPSEMDQLEFHTLFKDTLCFLVSSKLNKESPKSLGEIESGRHRFAMFGKNSYTNQIVESYLRSIGISPRSIVYFESMTAIKSFAMLGHGISILPQWVVQEELKQLEIIALPYEHQPLWRHWGILMPTGNKIEEVERLFIDLFATTIKEHGKEGWPIEYCAQEAASPSTRMNYHLKER